MEFFEAFRGGFDVSGLVSPDDDLDWEKPTHAKPSFFLLRSSFWAGFAALREAGVSARFDFWRAFDGAFRNFSWRI